MSRKQRWYQRRDDPRPDLQCGSARLTAKGPIAEKTESSCGGFVAVNRDPKSVLTTRSAVGQTTVGEDDPTRCLVIR